ncbi:MAG TPA: hypothetical protein VM818_18745 [Vicinamibacterales bacterium]|jgi:ABC-type phosphate transport system auxiliary subunit|nr:hypothetical protein [Vicinamibacterales bacterium]
MPSVEERLASLEARVDTMEDLPTQITGLRGDMNRQFTELRTDTNHQITELRADTNRQFMELRADMNRQFSEVRTDMNQRFEQVNGRIDTLDAKIDRHFTRLVGIQVASMLAVLGALLGAYYR